MKHNPASEAWMNAHSPKLSICEVIRKIYHGTDNAELKERCRLACGMAKDMSKKISELTGGDEWYQDYWDDNPEV